jgi:hypothetical protein
VGEDLDQPESETVYRDCLHVLSALSGASRHYAELSELLPEREPDAVDCACSEHPQNFRARKGHLCDLRRDGLVATRSARLPISSGGLGRECRKR